MSDLKLEKNAVTWLRIIYPLWAVIGMYSLMYVPSTLIDKSDPALTANNIINNELLFRSGIVGSLITQLIGIAAVWFLYRLFYKTFKELTISMAVLSFLGVPIAMLSLAPLYGVLEVTSDPNKVMFLIKLSTHGTLIASIFWGLWLVPIGYMAIKSPLFPSFLGWFLYLGGLGYFISAFAYFAGLEGRMVNVLDMLTMGEVVWMLWVLIMGARWPKLEAA